jgi:acyl-CoA thioester hydrolase
MEGFSFSTEVQVRFAETDAQGIAHHAAFLVWFEVARVAWLDEHAGGYKAIRERGIEALTTAAAARYHRAAHFHDRLTVWTRCAEIRGARFRYEYRIERDGDLIADGETSHATVDAGTRRPIRVPEWFADAIASGRAEDLRTADRPES